mgnify:CR=1 FL=1
MVGAVSMHIWFMLKEGVYGKTYVVPALVLTFCLCMSAMPQTALCSSVPYDPEGIFSTQADDGTTIMLYRYRPDAKAAFRTEGTPVLLFTGIVENMNQYLSCTPEVMQNSYSRLNLPDEIADWAIAKDPQGRPLYQDGRPVLEPFIQADRMRYYSLAHYLWLQGYDPWFANYRDTGRLNLRSQGDNKCTLNTLDTWATLDVPAAIAKVRSITGKRLYIGGHSTGGLVSYAYLQGCYLDFNNQADKTAYYQAAAEEGYQPHVKADPLLSLERNADIKGFIALDPAGRPPLPSYLNSDIFWTLMSSRFYLPLDVASQSIFQLFPTEVTVTVEQVLFGAINTWDQIYLMNGMENSLFGYLDFWYMQDTNRYMQDFMARYVLSGCSVRCLAQYMGNGLNQTIREFWMNGIENKGTIIPPKPAPGSDGYYYYSEHMDRVTVPMIACLSDSGSLVDPLYAYQDIISKKAPHDLDEWYTIEGTAHVDLVIGKKTPSEVFPKVGAWLAKVEAADAAAAADADTQGATGKGASQAATDDSGGGSSGGGCFIASAASW